MRISVTLVVIVISLLAGIAGYVLATAPWPSTQPLSTMDETSDAKTGEGETPGSAASIELGSASSTKPSTDTLPTLDSFYLSADTQPLPLTLQAGVFFSASEAQARVDQLKAIDYKSDIQKIRDNTNTALFLVTLPPFKNESELQLAQYQLYKDANISTQRVLMPTPN